MNILALTVQNIGPFFNQTISVRFSPGQYLISAPIGTGKSFLFFDSPMYALYGASKYKDRDILNTNASQGLLQLLREVDGQHRLIERRLQKTKCQTTLWRVERGESDLESLLSHWLPDIVNYEHHRFAQLNSAIVCVPQIFKNETDCNANIASLLPDIEIFQHRNMLMQSSENLFEMTVGKRIDFFKQLFGLLEIDVAKSLLATKKSELKGSIATQKDTTSSETKLINYFGQIQSLFVQYPDIAQHNPSLQQFINQNNLFDHHIATLTTLDTTYLALDSLWSTHLEQYFSDHQRIAQHITTIIQSLQQCEEEKKSLSAQHIVHHTTLQDLQSQLIHYSEDHLIQLTHEKISLTEYITSQQSLIDRKILNHHGYQVFDIVSAQQTVLSIISHGQDLRIKAASIQQHITDIQHQSKSTYLENSSLLERRIVSLQNDYTTKLASITHLQEQVRLLHLPDCQPSQELCATCPLHHTSSKSKDEVVHLESQIIVLSREIEESDYVGQIQLLQQQRAVLTHEVDTSELTAQHLVIMKDIDHLKMLLQSIDRPLLEKTAQQISQCNARLTLLDTQIQENQQGINALAHIKGQIEGLQTTVTMIQQQLLKLDDQLFCHQQELTTAQDQKSQMVDISLLMCRKEVTQQLEKMIDAILGLKQDFIEQQGRIASQENQLKIVNDLHTIVSKELMIMVLKEYIPQLQDTLNNLLSKVVEYQVKFDINDDGDKMDILIRDTLGEREVKSLSGGQKTVLRLCRILAIATLSRNKFLFLDETINNLDASAIAKVAELLQDFVMIHPIKLFIVTHSSQIQSMNIWTDIIVLRSLSS